MYQNRLNILNIGFQREYFDILKNNMEENGIVFSDIAPYFTAQEKGVHYFFSNSFWKMYVLKAFVLSFLSVKAKIKKKLEINK